MSSSMSQRAADAIMFEHLREMADEARKSQPASSSVKRLLSEARRQRTSVRQLCGQFAGAGRELAV